MSSQPPHYQRVAEVLLGQIAAGTYALGDRLPTETDLSEQFGLARETIRRGLDRLEQLGMIERRAGKGTRVVSTVPAGSYPTFATSARDIKSLATATRLRHPKSAEITVDAALARRIGTRAGSRWFVMEGPEFAGRVPTSRSAGVSTTCGPTCQERLSSPAHSTLKTSPQSRSNRR
jgi:GntR family transcriptional regulator